MKLDRMLAVPSAYIGVCKTVFSLGQNPAVRIMQCRACSKLLQHSQ